MNPEPQGSSPRRIHLSTRVSRKKGALDYHADFVFGSGVHLNTLIWDLTSMLNAGIHLAIDGRPVCDTLDRKWHARS